MPSTQSHFVAGIRRPPLGEPQTPRFPRPDESPVDGRSDNLEQRVTSYLAQRSVPGTNRLAVEVHGASVIIRGKLPSTQAKWLCLACCRRVAGVVRLIDQVEVDESPATEMTGIGLVDVRGEARIKEEIR